MWKEFEELNFEVEHWKHEAYNSKREKEDLIEGWKSVVEELEASKKV